MRAILTFIEAAIAAPVNADEEFTSQHQGEVDDTAPQSVAQSLAASGKSIQQSTLGGPLEKLSVALT